MHTAIEVDGFEEWPLLRAQLLAYITEYCAGMTLAQAREWYESAWPGMVS